MFFCHPNGLKSVATRLAEALPPVFYELNVTNHQTYEVLNGEALNEAIKNK
ncbi:MAG: hypothetical protein JWR09_1051 [Mucilaginibacter sp.]|nr:hypothetical protein [Mucilaginibacter sp.]